MVDGARYVRPATLDEALEILASTDPKPLLIAGSTDIGVELNIRGSRPPLLVAIDRLAELRELAVGDDEIRIGAALTLTEIERALDGQVPLLGALFPQFASRLIRNGGTIGGNLGTGSPIGDSPPVLLALDARLVLTSRRGERVVPLTEYFTGYRQSVRAADELIREIRIPRPLATITAFHKIAKRRFDDISSVAVAFALDVVDGHVARAAIGLGGVAATPIRGSEAEALLVGQPWSAETVAAAAEALGRGNTRTSRASSTYRAAMLRQSLLRHAECGGRIMASYAAPGWAVVAGPCTPRARSGTGRPPHRWPARPSWDVSRVAVQTDRRTPRSPGSTLASGCRWSAFTAADVPAAGSTTPASSMTGRLSDGSATGHSWWVLARPRCSAPGRLA